MHRNCLNHVKHHIKHYNYIINYKINLLYFKYFAIAILYDTHILVVQINVLVLVSMLTESCGRPAATSKKGGSCDAAAPGHGPTLKRGWFPKP